MIDDTIGIAQLGVRNHGATILHAITHTSGLRLACCHDTHREALADACSRYGVPAAESYEAILDDPSIDAVALVTPNHLHCEQMLQAFAHGKHVFVEKPIANTVAEAEECIRAANAADRVLLVGHNMRRRHSFREAKRWIDEGRLGAIVSVDANLSRHAGLEAGVPSWKLDPALCTLLPMTQLGIHFVDVTEYFFGDADEVFCEGWNAGVPGGAIDSTIAILRGRNIPTTVISSFYTTQETLAYRVHGSEGIMTVGATALHATLNGAPHDMDFSNEGYHSFIEQMEEFAACIRAEREPETSGESALRALRIVEAMRRSIAARSFVRVEDVR
jgi:predicted dehydrogenase